MGENEYDKSGHFSISTSLKHLMMLLESNFSGLHFDTLSKTLIAWWGMQLRFFKVVTLLNSAFKSWNYNYSSYDKWKYVSVYDTSLYMFVIHIKKKFMV